MTEIYFLSVCYVAYRKVMNIIHVLYISGFFYLTCPAYFSITKDIPHYFHFIATLREFTRMSRSWCFCI